MREGHRAIGGVRPADKTADLAKDSLHTATDETEKRETATENVNIRSF